MTKFYDKIDNLSVNDLNWLSIDYNALTFEKWDIFNIEYIKFMKVIKFQNLCRPKRFFKYFKKIFKKYKLYINNQ